MHTESKFVCDNAEDRAIFEERRHEETVPWESVKAKPEPDLDSKRQVWICQHHSVPMNFDTEINSAVTKAWFLSNAGVEEKNLNEFSRFAAMHITLSWWKGGFIPPRSGIFERGKHTFGLVRFAFLQNTKKIMLEMNWSGLNGCGYTVVLENKQVVIEQENWKS
jgi:hypothetical protein